MINGECASDSKEATPSTLRLWITIEEVGDERSKPYAAHSSGGNFT
jgi:hypothetical protein